MLKRQLPERAAVLTIGAALQESKLRNLAAGTGDRDSVGILQQRPSQGWGTAAQISNVQYATGKFLDAVVKVPNWQSDSLATVVQAVQVSADGAAYAQHEAEAQADLRRTGRGQGRWASAAPSASRGSWPAPPRSSRRSGEPAGEHARSQAGARSRSAGAGWATASWFVCNADSLGIDSVAYNGQNWSRSKGWKPDAAATKAAVIATMAKV